MPRTRNLGRNPRDVYQPRAVVEAVAESQPEGEQDRETLAFFSVEGVHGMAHHAPCGPSVDAKVEQGLRALHLELRLGGGPCEVHGLLQVHDFWDASHDAAQKVWDEFWDRNRMDERIDMFARDLCWAGEQFMREVCSLWIEKQQLLARLCYRTYRECHRLILSAIPEWQEIAIVAREGLP